MMIDKKELNTAIAKALGYEIVDHFIVNSPVVYYKNPNKNKHPKICAKNYCENWNHLIPLIIKNSYSFSFYNSNDLHDWKDIENLQEKLCSDLLRVLL